MSRSLYHRYMVLCKKWPLDETKKGRDLGEYLRQYIAHEFRHGETTEISDLQDCEQKYQSLQRLASNHYKKQYPLGGKRSTSCCMTLEQCKQVISTETLDALRERTLPFWKRKSFWSK